MSLPLALALVVFVAATWSPFALTDPDSYWHVAVGRWIATMRQIPTHDMFSYTMRGAPWTAHEWLSELIMYGAYRLDGWAGLQLLASACFAVTAGYMLRFSLRRMEPVHALPMVVLSLALMNTHFLARPHVLVWPLTALWVGTLADSAESRRAPSWWLVLAMLAWANLHASFTLGVGFAGALATDAFFQETTADGRMRVIKQWGALLMACGLALLVNPQGIGVFGFAAGVMSMKATLEVIGEWQSANFHVFHFFLVWLGALLALSFTGRLRLSAIRALFMLGVIYLALKHQRYHALLGLTSPFILALPIAQAFATRRGGAATQASSLDRWFAARSRPAHIGGLLCMVACAVLYATIGHRLVRSEPSELTTPVAALAAAQSPGTRGHVFNSYAFGGYLIFRNVPVFIDGRADLYGDAFVEHAADAAALKKPRALETLLAKYDIEWTLLAPQSPSVELLDHLPEWRRLYADSIAVVHVRQRVSR